jgi:preprotein translocase subunit YajC
MDSCSQLTIPAKTVVITNNTYFHPPIPPNNYYFKVHNNVNSITLNDLELLKGYDITGIHMEFTDNLKHIVIKFGNSCIFFDKDMQEYLKTFPIYLTLSKYLNIYISFIYDDDWFDKNIEYEEVKEYEEVDEYSDESVTIWDGDEYHTGKIVLGRRMEETGKMIKKITKGAEVVLPEIRFDIAKIKHKDGTVRCPVRQKITLKPTMNDEYKNKLVKNHNLTLINDNTRNLTERPAELNAYIDNEIIYTSNLMSLYYIF